MTPCAACWPTGGCPFCDDGWAGLYDTGGLEFFRRFVATEQASPTLRARRLVIAESWAERLSAVLAVELDVPPDDLGVRTLAAMIVATLGLRERELSAAVMDRVPPAEVERRVRAVVDASLCRLALAWGDLEGRLLPETPS